MNQPINKNRRGDNEQPEHLIPPEDARLLGAPILFGNLLIVRLDAGLNHCLIDYCPA